MFIGEENPTTTTTTTTVNHEDNLADNATEVPSEACSKINSAKNGVKINLNNGNSKNKNTNLRMQGTGFFIINLLKQDKQNIDNALNELVQLFK